MGSGIDAVVLRTLRYGEADVIAQVFTREDGRRGVIAKGARKPRSRIGTRLEPFLAVRMQLVSGRGDLAIVRSVEIDAAHDGLRESWRAQQVAAAALDLVTRLTIEHHPSEPIYHLLRKLLEQLDVTARAANVPDGAEEQRSLALLVAFELKLLHVLGIAPQLGACVRCGDSELYVAGFSAADGGVVCRSCRAPGDQGIEAPVYEAAVRMMRSPLAQISGAPADELPPLRVTRSVATIIVTGTSLEHAGVRPRNPG